MHFRDENFYILNKVLLKFVYNGPIDNNPDNLFYNLAAACDSQLVLVKT